MSHNSYVMPGGIWPPSTVLTHTMAQAIDQTLYKCVNGDDGGTWAPAGAIVIGGAGLVTSVPFTATAGLEADGTNNFGSPIIPGSGNSYFNQPASFFYAATFAAPANFQGSATIGSTGADLLTVNAAAT